MSPKWFIPRCLVMSRVVLAPVAIFLCLNHAPTWLWMTQFLFAVLSDWLDGKLARRWGTSTPGIRQADSLADTVYALAIAICLWINHPDIVTQHAWMLVVLIALEAIRYPLDWALFGRGASYHAISAKVFGASIVVAITGIIGFDYVGPLLSISLTLGILSEIDGIIISMILPQWTCDVKHIGKAIEIRNRARPVPFEMKRRR